MLDRILLPVDLTESSQIGFDTVRNLAKRFNSQVYIIYVLEPIRDLPFEIFGEEKAALDSLKDKLSEEADRVLKNYTSTLLSEGVKAEYRIIEGDEVESILDFSAFINSDTIVMPAHKKTKIEHKALGSTSLRVSSKSKSSVLVLKNKPLIDVKKILVNYDFLSSSIKALEKAAFLARSYNCSITVLHVDNDEHYTHLKSIYNKMLERKNSLLNSIKEAYGDLNIETLLLKGNPKEKILDVLNRDGYDLVVMGKRNPVNKGRVFIGSLSLEILKNSPVSVLISRGDYE